MYFADFKELLSDLVHQVRDGFGPVRRDIELELNIAERQVTRDVAVTSPGDINGTFDPHSPAPAPKNTPSPRKASISEPPHRDPLPLFRNFVSARAHVSATAHSFLVLPEFIEPRGMINALRPV